MSEKCTQWCGNGPKVAHLGPKSPFSGHKRLQTPQMAGKSGSNGGSQLNTCGGTTLGAKLVRKTHPVVWKWPKNCPYWTKNDYFFASNGPLWGHFHTTGCIFLANFASRVDPPNMFHCDPPFVPLLPSIWGLLGLLWPKKVFWAQNWPFLGHFHSIGCIFLTSFASRVVPPHVFHCDPPFVPLLPALGGL